MDTKNLKKALSAAKDYEMTLTISGASTRESLLSEMGYNVDQAIGGQYRLIAPDGTVVVDDSACEDYYDKDMAIYLFLLHLCDEGAFAEE